ncbi:MAG: hypothetical protein KKB21_04515 [Nanoarchaeota archaeon]|nr:hypothetical protein [Nanoarchaeota archaeon]MBU4086809.1 hypothetical protein [Nanoarchaeota archaeon]
MLVKVPVISNKTRRVLQAQLSKDFPEVEDKGDLDSVVSEVLGDRDIFMFLAGHLPEGKGLKLGMSNYWDDTNVYVHYGLALDLEVHRKTKLFTSASFNPYGLEPKEFGLYSQFPSWGVYRLAEWPSSEEFAERVNNVLQNPKPYLINLPSSKREI